MVIEYDILAIRASIGRLEESVKTIYGQPGDQNLRIPPLIGADGILLRTFGPNYQMPEKKHGKKTGNIYGPPQSFNRLNVNIPTEFAGFVDAKEDYDGCPCREHVFNLLAEAGDIIFQKAVLDVYYSANPDDSIYKNTKEKFDTTLAYIGQELKERGFSIEHARRMAEVKYGARSWLLRHGRAQNSSELERKLGIEEIKPMKIK